MRPQNFSRMANPKRLLILCLLLGQELRVGELSSRVDLAQSPLSQDLARLRALKLVATRRDGQSIRYRVASDEVARVLTTLHGIYCAPIVTSPSNQNRQRGATIIHSG